LEIIKGERVGVIGESGSGKSSLINLLLGLIEPRKGQILIDDVRLNDGNITSWRSKIGYIPQQIYLIDSSIRDNIVFFNDYDNEKFDKCIEKANLAHFISEDIDDRIGENGIMLSGGQAQRVAIARALYISPDIIILDEATSALDKETEREIINEIYQLDKDITVIIISHNEGILDKCDKIIRVSDQNVQRIK